MNLHRTLLLVVLMTCSASFAQAHDFWLQPSQYWIEPGLIDTLTLQVGHGLFRQRSPIPARRITRFEAVTATGSVVNLREQLRLGGDTADGTFQLNDAGDYILVLQTDDGAQTHLPPVRFNDYLNAEGLRPALEQRARLHQMDADGSERYSRCAKSIVHVGSADRGALEPVTRPVGLPLEIVPEQNPYSVPRAATLPVRVIYEGRPLTGALLKLTDLNNDAVPLESHLTDQQGRAIFVMPVAGPWLLNVIWTKALPRTAETDSETVFSSLSFALP